VNLRDQLEVEQNMCENLIPELTETELSKPRTVAEWTALLSRMHERMVSWSRRLVQNSSNAAPELRELTGWSLDRLKTKVLPAARAYRSGAAKTTTAFVLDALSNSMCDEQLVALYLAGRYRELRDDLFKSSYLLAQEAVSQQSAVEKRMDAAKSPALAFFLAIHAVDGSPLFMRALSSQLWLDRRIDVLRVIEAIRLYAAAHDGALPEALEQITEVAVPIDPATGKPFLYRRAGSAALLHAPQAGLRSPWTPYRITSRVGK